MGHDQEAVENAKGERRHGKEIHHRDGFTMIAQKGSPSLCRLRTPWGSPHPAQHRSLRDIEAKHLQLSMNPRSTPGGVLVDHTEDQFTQFPVHALSSRTNPMPRKPFPIHLESGLVPSHYGLRLDNNQRLLPSRPEPPQHNPEEPIRSSKSRLRTPLPQDRKLLPERQVFQQQVAARAKEVNSQNEQKPHRGQHETDSTWRQATLGPPVMCLI